VGAYNLQNIILAAGAGLHFEVPATSIVEAIAGFIPENQRSQLISGAGNHVIMDSYNANPSSMREAISGLLSYASTPTMLILGDMAELGAFSLDEHSELVQWIGTLNVDRVFLVGPIFSQVCEPSTRMIVFKKRQQLELHLKDEKPVGFHILVKGSRVCALENILGYLVD
jgi:UDP-N-acetylmuramoyl-tripeptide--D-alanyl-D-alanine ligase